MKSAIRHFIAHRLEKAVQRLISQQHLKVIGVTGSVGKTSTKLAIASVLGQKYRVLAHRGNYNSEIGLPLSVFELDAPKQLWNPFAWLKVFATIRIKSQSYRYEVLVLELGADRVGDIERFMRYLTPEVGVVTAVAPVHLELFGSIENILAEKFLLATGSSFAVINADDRRLMSRKQELEGHFTTFGDQGQYRFTEYDLQAGQPNGKLVLKDSTIEVQLHVIAEHNLYAIAAAAAVGDHFGLTPQQIHDGIQQIMPFDGRMNPLPGKNGSLIIDDTYNSSPTAVLAALNTLKGLSGKKIAVLGSMNELGDYAKQGHEDVGAACQGLDWLITIGAQAREFLAPAAIRAGLQPDQVKSFDFPQDAGQFVAGLLEPNVKVLAKGSQNGVFAEEAVKELLANPVDADKLVRQSRAWLRRKSVQLKKPVKPTAQGVAPRIKRITLQSLSEQLGEYAAVRSCAPTTLYMLAEAYGYLSPAQTTPTAFIGALQKDELRTANKDWIRPALSRELRQQYGMSIVSWQLQGGRDIQRMREAGYVSSDREIQFLERRVFSATVEELVHAGYPVIVTMLPGFGTTRNTNIHAVILTHWENRIVTVVDPDARNRKKYFTPGYVNRFLSPNGAGTIVLPISE